MRARSLLALLTKTSASRELLHLNESPFVVPQLKEFFPLFQGYILNASHHMHIQSKCVTELTIFSLLH